MVKSQGRYTSVPVSDKDETDKKEPSQVSDESSETRLMSIALVLVIHFFSNALIIPLLPTLLLQVFDGNRADTARCSGWLNALRNLLTFFTMPLWGTLSDVVGRKAIIRMGLFMNSLSWFILGSMPCYTTILIQTIINGSMVSIVTTSFAAISDVTSRVLRQRAELKALEKLQQVEESVVSVDELDRFLEGDSLDNIVWGKNPVKVGYRVAVKVEDEQGELEVVFGMVVAFDEDLPIVHIDGWQRSFVFEEWYVLHGEEFKLGERIHVCDKSSDMISNKVSKKASNDASNAWKPGVVSSFNEVGLPLVQLDGWDEAFPFDMYKKCLKNDIMDATDTQKGTNVLKGSNNGKKTAKGVTEGEEELSLLTANYAIVGCLWGFSFVVGPLIGGLLVGVGGDARFACFAVAISDSIALIIAQCCLKETIAHKTPKIKCSDINPFPPLMIFASSPELLVLVIPMLISVAAGGVHSILYLYFVVKFSWTPVMVGLFFSCVGLVTAITQGLILPCVIPNIISVRLALPLGLFIHAMEYALYSMCEHGWQLVVVLCACCLSQIEPPTLHALISSQVEPAKQGTLHGALSAIRTLVSVVAVPCFSMLFAWSIGSDNGQSINALKSSLGSTGEGLGSEEGGEVSEVGDLQQAAVDINLIKGIGSYFSNTSNVLGIFVESSEDLDTDKMESHESHLNIPFLVAAGLFLVACASSMLVLWRFPNLGKDGLKGSK